MLTFVMLAGGGLIMFAGQGSYVVWVIGALLVVCGLLRIALRGVDR